jgi:hypothetical protein
VDRRDGAAGVTIWADSTPTMWALGAIQAGRSPDPLHGLQRGARQAARTNIAIGATVCPAATIADPRCRLGAAEPAFEGYALGARVRVLWLVGGAAWRRGRFYTVSPLFSKAGDARVDRRVVGDRLGGMETVYWRGSRRGRFSVSSR